MPAAAARRLALVCVGLVGRPFGVAEGGVAVEGDLGVERQQGSARGDAQRVDLDQGGVVLAEQPPEVGQQLGELRGQRAVEARQRGELGELGGGQAAHGVEMLAR